MKKIYNKKGRRSNRISYDDLQTDLLDISFSIGKFCRKYRSESLFFGVIGLRSEDGLIMTPEPFWRGSLKDMIDLLVEAMEAEEFFKDLVFKAYHKYIEIEEEFKS